jgi:hypothetical protein
MSRATPISQKPNRRTSISLSRLALIQKGHARHPKHPSKPQRLQASRHDHKPRSYHRLAQVQSFVQFHTWL